MFSKLGLSSFINISSDSSFLAFFIFGLIAGFSTCAALVGGLILSLSKNWLELYGHGNSFIEKSKPHILFNLGRIISYFFVGGILGYLGAQLKISGTITSIVVLLVSILMLVLAMQMLGVKFFNRFKIALPKSFSKKVADTKNSKRKFAPFIVGFFTFLLPCGFTLASEGLAVLSGDAIRGSLIMLFFALGTAIPLLAIGLFSSLLVSNPKTSEKFLKIAGILIIFFVLYNINFQFGIIRDFTFSQNTIEKSQVNAEIENKNIKVIKAVYSKNLGIIPSNFELKVGQEVRLEILAKDNGSGCMSTIMIPKLWNSPKSLLKGETVIMDFIPSNVGIYQITCAMGVPWGTINVTN
jgi:uncharacterized protein